MRHKKALNLLLLPLVVGMFSSFNKPSENILNNSNSLNVLKANEEKLNLNTQTYETIEGTTNTIYWLQGLTDMPKMRKEATYNKPGYFDISYEGWPSYEAIYEYGHGYYDLNKNEKRRNSHKDEETGETVSESNLCYLASATNLLHWWLNQNQTRITKYIEKLNDGSFVQSESLVSLENAQSIFDNFYKEPELQTVPENNLKRQEIRYDTISWPLFLPYFKQKSGGFPDKVWDFFFNGYEPLGFADANKESDYSPNKNGGFFYPVFGTKQLTTRHTTSHYDDLSKYIYHYITHGYGVSLFYFIGANDASHALSLWGAEFDEQNNLKKVYVSDSDDYDSGRNGMSRGINVYHVSKDAQGLAHLGNSPTAYKNNLLLMGISALDLAQDEFDLILNDTNEVDVPDISLEPTDASYGNPNKNNVKTLETKASIYDTGKMTYQWYKAKNLDEEGVLIDGETKSYYTPDIAKESDKTTNYYYCLITNTKRGKTASIKTRYAKIVKDSSLTDAQTPYVSATGPNNPKKWYYQYTNPGIIKVNASTYDDGELTYDWYKGDGLYSSYELIPDYHETYMIPDTSTLKVVKYKCIVTNTKKDATGMKTSSVETNEFRLDIVDSEGTLKDTAAPYIIEGPISATYYKNAVVTPLIAKSGTSDGGTLTYQWYKSTTPDATSDGILIDGANTDTYTPSSATSGDFYYYCRVTNTNANLFNTTTYKDSSKAHIKINGEEPEKSSNAFLSDLKINGTTISNFNKNTLSYEMDVENSVNTATITATVEDTGKADYKVNGTSLLTIGENNFSIVVTAEDGTTKTYTIKITRAEASIPDPEPEPEKSSNANLSDLKVNGTTVSNFNKNTLSYEMDVENSVNTATITATVEDTGKADYKVNGTSSLTVGKNNFSVVVTAEDGTTKTYTIKITRAVASIPDPEPEKPTKIDGKLTRIIVGSTLGSLALIVGIIFIVIFIKK